MTSKRIQKMTPSVTSMLIGKIAEKRAAGADIISFSAGEPDFPTPPAIVDSCCQALKAGKTKYESVAGILPLRTAICQKLLRDNGLTYQPNQICVSTGAKQALFNAVMALCDEGDEVILPFPCWVSYVEMVKLAGGVPVLVPTTPDFSLDIAAIEKAVTKKTKAIIINSPNNPTGAVYPKETLEQLGKIVLKNHLYVISDEVYEKLVYGDHTHFSIANLSPELYQRTVVINGFSKAYSMTGWRIGYSAASVEITKAMTGLQSHISSNSTSFVQWASIEALDHGTNSIETMRREFEKRRNYMWSRLQQMPGISCLCPDGAFYLMPNVSFYVGKRYGDWIINDSATLCEFLLEQGGIAVVPGEAYYMPNTLRFAYSTSMKLIEEGMNRMERALALLQ